MCGIAGQVGRDPRTIQSRYAAYCAMQQTLARRGPDQRGMFISGRAALIHARLAVVDLENGLQPMQLDWQGETYVLVYNGELYNTPELRAALLYFPAQIAVFFPGIGWIQAVASALSTGWLNWVLNVVLNGNYDGFIHLVAYNLTHSCFTKVSFAHLAFPPSLKRWCCRF